jgi:hypothetical protein
MSKIGSWSTSAGSNTATPPDGFPEGMAPSGVNDGIREIMAQVKTFANDAEWFDRDWTPTYATVNSFTVTGDRTSALHSGRALKLYDSSTIVRRITSASFTAVTTVLLDSGTALTSSLSSFAVGVQAQTPRSGPRTPYLLVAAGSPITFSATTATAIFSAVAFDNTGWYSSATGRYTPLLPGVYATALRAQVIAQSGTAALRLDIRKNGSGSAGAVFFVDGIGDFQTGNGFARMNGTTDYLNIQGYVLSATGAVVIDSSSPLWITYLGPV